jgi:uncharacterized membrane protein YjfL (UPF0719 family)
LIFAVCNLAGSAQVAQVVTALCLGFFFIFAGFYINANSIPDYYIWAKYSSFIKVTPLPPSLLAVSRVVTIARV